jgi:hypothetical protein
VTTITALQQYLAGTHRYQGRIDGVWGPKTEGAILGAMEDGPDTPLTDQDFASSAARLGCRVSHIKAVAEVEAAGAGFFQGKPKILPERHIFSKLTRGRFDQSHPQLSYPRWGTRPYPKTQGDRYRLLLDMARLDIDAGFAAASWGKFQILGQHCTTCGYETPWQFAFAMAVDEPTQLRAFEAFIESEGMVPFLRQGLWANFAKRYNGPAYAKNQYDVKLAKAAWRHGSAQA